MYSPRFLATNHLALYPKVDSPSLAMSYPMELRNRCRPQVGSSVRSVKPGDRVAMEPGISCRRCESCRTGRYQVCDTKIQSLPPMVHSQLNKLCPDMAFAATPPYDGTLTRYYRLPEDLVYILPEGLSLEDGAMVRCIQSSSACAQSSSDGASFGWCSLRLHASQVTTSSINRDLWLWTCWASLHGCGKGHRCFEDHRC